MKQLKYFLFVAALAMVFLGCSKPVEVSFATSTQTIEAEGGSVEVSLKSNGEWSIESMAEWLTVSPKSGNGDATLTLSAEANTSGEERSAEIKATTKDNSASITVTQEAVVQPPQPEDYLNVTPRELECGSDGAEFAVEVSSNIDWIVTSPDWITSSVTEGSNNATVILTINPVDGEFAELREADVVFGSSLVSDEVHVIQRPDPILNINVTPNNLVFVCTGETKFVVVSTEDAWTATVEENWVTLSQTEGQGDAEISVTVGENPLYESRQTSVTFTTAGGIQTIVGIRQDATPDPHFLEVSPLEFQFGKEGGEREITIGCDTDWLFDLDCEWLSLSQISGTGNATVVLTAVPNMITEPRATDFHIKSGELNYRFSVRQEAGDTPLMASFNMDTLSVSYTGGVYSLQLTSNTSWQLQFSDWISSQIHSGQGDASVSIIVDNNSYAEGRMGYVNVVHNGQVLASLIVAQEGKPNLLEVDFTVLDVRPEGDEIVIHVTSNQAWTVNVDVGWIHCNPLSGFANGTFTVTVDALSSPRPREGHIKVNGETGIDVTITVSQQP